MVARTARPIGSLELDSQEMRGIVEEVVEEAEEARQASFDAVMQILGEVVRGEEADALLSQLTSQGLAQLMATQPEQARELLQDARRRAKEAT